MRGVWPKSKGYTVVPGRIGEREVTRANQINADKTDDDDEQNH